MRLFYRLKATTVVLLLLHTIIVFSCTYLFCSSYNCGGSRGCESGPEGHGLLLRNSYNDQADLGKKVLDDHEDLSKKEKETMPKHRHVKGNLKKPPNNNAFV